jgi:hypothetical protein
MSVTFICSHKFCNTKVLKIQCNVCKTLYCSEKCREICSKKHQKYCDLSYVEKLILIIHNKQILAKKKFEQKQRVFCFNILYEFETKISFENLNIVDLCMYCKESFKFNCNEGIDFCWYGHVCTFIFSKCSNCLLKQPHNICRLPHDKTQECPLVKRFIYLLLSFPLLKKLPTEIRVMIFKMIRQNFVDYLFL